MTPACMDYVNCVRAPRDSVEKHSDEIKIIVLPDDNYKSSLFNAIVWFSRIPEYILVLKVPKPQCPYLPVH